MHPLLHYITLKLAPFTQGIWEPSLATLPVGKTALLFFFSANSWQVANSVHSSPGCSEISRCFHRQFQVLPYEISFIYWPISSLLIALFCLSLIFSHYFVFCGLLSICEGRVTLDWSLCRSLHHLRKVLEWKGIV